jgi:GT2 family glycosyltransferase
MKIESSRDARATLVMAARERHALTERSIESIVRVTRRPYRFVYLDVQSPEWLREILTRRSGEWGLDVFRFDEPLWPHEARNRIVADIDTDYVVFIDNDVVVEDGWLDALVACADETGAGVVGPLYLWGDGTRPPRIHMAGGILTEELAADGRHLIDDHVLSDADPEKLEAPLRRRPCDFAEYHCMLIRTSLVRDGKLLDPTLRCVHEHVDTALSVRQRGFPVFLEPASRVTYLASADFTLEDLPFFRRRWSILEADANIAAFSRKWNVVNGDRSFRGVRDFVFKHVADVDPIRLTAHAPPDRHAPMRREELKQTRSDLLDLAIERGYRDQELTVIADAYHLAHLLTAGGYRPCGRPFVNHLVGTASVLVRYDFRAETVAAGLLHAVYSHSRPHPDGPRAAVKALATLLGGVGSPIELTVRAYTQRESHWSGLTPEAADSVFKPSIREAEILAIAAANEVDMALSGEARYSGRTDLLKPEVTRRIAAVCEILGVGGLAQTLTAARQSHAVARPELSTKMRGSYRVAWARQDLTPMFNNETINALAE